MFSDTTELIPNRATLKPLKIANEETIEGFLHDAIDADQIIMLQMDVIRRSLSQRSKLNRNFDKIEESSRKNANLLNAIHTLWSQRAIGLR